MKTESHSINDVLAKNATSFFIPPFQRAYAWGKPEIERYFSDVSRIIESHLDPKQQQVLWRNYSCLTTQFKSNWSDEAQYGCTQNTFHVSIKNHTNKNDETVKNMETFKQKALRLFYPLIRKVVKSGKKGTWPWSAGPTISTTLTLKYNY